MQVPYFDKKGQKLETVSVIIPSYQNKLDEIEEALDSHNPGSQLDTDFRESKVQNIVNN